MMLVQILCLLPCLSLRCRLEINVLPKKAEPELFT